MKVEENTISFYIDELVNSTLFNAEANLCLHHIFTQIPASKEQTESMLNYRQYGHEGMKNYIDCYLLRAKDMAAKQTARIRRNLKTFTAPTVTVFKQKKEIKDNQTVISCLRKQIAFSKLTQKPVTDLDQFSTLPRSISDANGIPEDGQTRKWSKICCIADIQIIVQGGICLVFTRLQK
jgi:hypothetical protein